MCSECGDTAAGARPRSRRVTLRTRVVDERGLTTTLMFCYNSYVEGAKVTWSSAYKRHLIDIHSQSTLILFQIMQTAFKNRMNGYEDKDRSGRPEIYKDAELEDLLEEDSSQTQKERVLTIEAIQQTLWYRLKSLGMIHKLAVPVKNYLKTFDWEVLPQPPYSPDIAPSDYHLFRSMAHALSEQRFTSYEDTKDWVDSWIVSKDKEFFRLEIRKLSERWKKVVASDGQYFD
ncbi:Mariner Mos1 transposase [Eumeta japonica]|uniref:Mariner Mos1 transposase n=1 Tax=Eumeta variegata TaxID=151549 RepID=A0A4C1SBK7_EUMVA|nr:Mariner Mos1 transposase [Eumeta japonica]